MIIANQQLHRFQKLIKIWYYNYALPFNELKRIEREVKKPKRITILNKITISKSVIKSTVFAKHIKQKNWFDDEVT